MAVELQRATHQHPLGLLHALPDSFSTSSMSPQTSPKTVPPRHGFVTAPVDLASNERMSYHLHRLQMPSPPGPPLMGPQHPFGSASLSPGAGPTPIRESLSSPAVNDYPALAAAQLSAARLHAQKRAYRQRRKDPSCDACRERKVKCDATETTSCSECSSRNVKCQFTKETNRRMSSIKQVQDLERQLSHARQQLYQLRSTRTVRSPPQTGPELTSPVSLLPPQIEVHRARRQYPLLTQDFTQVQTNLQRYAHGIFQPLVPQGQSGPQAWPLRAHPALPPKDVSDDLLSSYHTTIHAAFPVLNWPDFCQTYESVYRTGTFHSATPSWGALLFSVLACGTISTAQPSLGRPQDGASYLQASQTFMDPWNDDCTVDGARACLLTAVFFFETNRKSTAWIWLGSSVRICQSLGLYLEHGAWPATEGRVRKRLWWSVYIWDRLLSLELGRPLQIDDEDCDVELPLPIHEQDIFDSGTSSLLFNVDVLQCLSQLAKATRAYTIDHGILNISDARFESCMAALSPQLQPHSPLPLDPQCLGPICHLQNARLILHRRSMSPSFSPEVRTAAIDSCLAVARDTFGYLYRLTSDQSPTFDSRRSSGLWKERLCSVASAMLCTHLWRCTLFLCFRGYFAEGKLCAKTSAAIGDLRVINTACGKNLTFFLGRLMEKLRRGEGQGLDADEEMMAYLSGDLQGEPRDAWVWQGTDTRSDLSPIGYHSSFPGIGGETRRTEPLSASRVSSPVESEVWAGWDHVLWLLENFLVEQGVGRGVQGQSPTRLTTLTSPQPTRSTSTSRISIADII